MNKEVVVSVIIPTYNSAHYLAATIDSVLAQTFKEIEILVVDDGSTDNTREILEKYGDLICYLYKSNGGVASARNYGIEKSKAKYVAFLDSDDIWLPEKLEKQIESLTKNSNAKVCYTALRKVSDNLEPIGIIENERGNSLVEDLLLTGNVVGSPSSVVILRELFKLCGVFDENLSQCADWEMWIRLAIQTDFMFINEPLVNYRIHIANMSKNPSLLEKDTILLLNKGFSLSEIPDALRKKRNKAFAKNFMVLAGSYFHAGMYKDFLRCLWKSMKFDFSQVQYLVQFPMRYYNHKQN